MRRIAKVHIHSLKVKVEWRARGARGQQWYHDHRVQFMCGDLLVTVLCVRMTPVLAKQ